MLSTAQLGFNKSKFQETNQKYGIFTKELEDFMGDEFYLSPLSTNLTMAGSYPGGLLHISIKSCKYSIKINEILPIELKQSIDDIVRVTFLSQIGKVYTVKLNTNEYQVKSGKMYEFVDDIVRLRMGERSIFYATKYGVKLSEKEFQAILNFDKDNEDKMAKYFSEPLTYILKMGFDLAIMEEKNGKKGN